MDGFTGGGYPEWTDSRGGVSRMDVENSPDAHKPVEISDSGFLTIRERPGEPRGPNRPAKAAERLGKAIQLGGAVREPEGPLVSRARGSRHPEPSRSSTPARPS